jgi:large subunit ribosomal protein L29
MGEKAIESKAIRGMRDEELGIELKRLRTALYDLGAQRTSQAVEDTSQFRTVRKNIARLLTEQQARLLKANPRQHAGKRAGKAPSAVAPTKPNPVKAAAKTKAPAAVKASTKKPAVKKAEK